MTGNSFSDDLGVNPWREVARSLLQAVREYVDSRTAAWLTNSGKINLSSGIAGFTGVLPPSLGGTGTNTGGPNYAYVPMIDSSGNIVTNSAGEPLLVKTTVA